MASRKLCLVTGGNGGIGYEVAKILKDRGHDVILACRDAQRGEAAVRSLSSTGGSSVHMVPCDLADLSSVRKCADEVSKKWQRLDVLVCNAAVITSKPQTTKEGLDEMFQVNHLSHFLLTHLLLPLLTKSPEGRICCVSSELHKRIKPEEASPTILQPYNPNTTPWNSMTMYAHTKLYNVWFTRYLAQLLPETMAVNAASPGFAPATSLGRHTGGFLGGLAMRYIMPWAPFAVTPAEGGRRIVEACLLPGDSKVTGKYFSKGGEAEVSAAALDEQKAEELWKLSMELTGMRKYL